jgi:hypothetical protein
MNFSKIRPLSRQVHREPLKVGERAVSPGALASGTQDYARHLACLECFLPPWGTQTPPITGYKPGKPNSGIRVERSSARFGKIEGARKS